MARRVLQYELTLLFGYKEPEIIIKTDYFH